MKKILFIFLTLILSCPNFGFLQASTAKPIRILLVPGHDDEVWGAQFGKIKEADMNLVLATQIYNILKKDKRFKVYITRDSLGYTTEFADYFALHQAEIKDFKETAKEKNKDKLANGEFVATESVPHHGVSEDVSLKLYGISKWADENKIDAIIHIHFNDYPRPDPWTIGRYKGFVIYVPEKQLLNEKLSFPLAYSIYSELIKKYETSTYEKELGGIKFDQTLIALGAKQTLLPSVRSILIEYGYIYEKKFRDSVTRHKAYTTMAELTAKGIKSYFIKSR